MTFALASPERMIRSAEISPCGRYRYALARTWGVSTAAAVFVLLNPSTADGIKDDPTLRRLIGFARSWGYGRLIVVNLFAWRATDPTELWRAKDPIGAENDRWIGEAVGTAGVVVCGWGKHGTLRGRDRDVLAIIRDAGVQPSFLKLNGNGSPAHPLYLPGHLQPTVWRVAA